MSSASEEAITNLDMASSYSRARAAHIVEMANTWSGHDYERDQMLKSAAQMMRDADTFAGRSNLISMFGLDYEPIEPDGGGER